MTCTCDRRNGEVCDKCAGVSHAKEPTPDTPTNWEADLGITPADIRKTVNVAKLRAAILKEKSLSERQGAQDFVKLIKETAPSYESLIGTVYRVGEWTLKTPWMDFSDRTQEVEGEPEKV